MRRAKVVIEHERLRSLLSIPDSVEIVALTIRQDPLTLQIHLAGDSLPEECFEAKVDRMAFGRNGESMIIALDTLQKLA